MSSSEDDSSVANPLRNIRKLRSDLCHMIDVRHGLLLVLRSAHVLNDDQIGLIERKTTHYSATDQLLDVIVTLSQRKQKLFLNALFKTRQQHINNYIVSNACRPPTDDGNWPLFASDVCDHINVNWSELIVTIDSVNGLLDELLTAKCINRHHKKTIESRETCVGKNEALLNILKRGSFNDYRRFIRCLKNSKQCQVVSLLESNSHGNNKSLGEELKKRLSVSQPALIELINTRKGLLSHLMHGDCITQRQKEFIDSATSRSRRNSRLMKIITRGCMPDYEQFVACLARSGQQHVTRILVEDGVVARLVGKLGKRRMCTLLYSRGTGRSDPYNVERSKSVSTHSAEELRQLLSKAVCFGSDVELIAVVLNSDIGLFYLCTSLRGLLHLQEQYASGLLCLRLNALLEDDKDGCLPVVNSLSWNMSHYMKSCQYMYHCLGMSVFSSLYSLTRGGCHIDSSARCASVSFERLPPELIETLLIRTAGKLFRALNVMIPDARVYAVATLCSVSGVWWRTFTNRTYVKRLLFRYVRQVCLPYKCRPRRLPALRVERSIAGVAEFCRKLFVACEESNTILVFDSCSPPFARLQSITVHGLAHPVDIVVCCDTAQLYIADCKQCAIWRVNLLSYKQVDKFVSTQCQPFSLSTKSRRLLVTSSDSDALYIYDNDGVLLTHIKLPDYMAATYAVETQRKTYLVSHGSHDYSSPGRSDQETVSEVDVNGRVIRSFSGQHKDVGPARLYQPHYLALGDDNCVIVADHFNKRIVLLDEHLQLKRVWICSLNGQPYRLCFCRRTRLLFVVNYFSNDVLVYHV